MTTEYNRINVTKPFLPPLEEFVAYLEDIWSEKWLTNNGKYHQQFEKELSDYLGVEHISLFVNGTLALITALQALKISEEVLTTPFSFVATAHSLWWNNIKPVFVDIEEDYFNIDADKIEPAITPNTTAILPVHVYGNPSNVEQIQNIADTYELKVLYDAAHSFEVRFDIKPIVSYGDMSIISFHSTKVFTTFEGGAIITKSEAMKKRIDYLKNFGFANETTVVGPGINAKMNEFQVALGILQLKHIDNAIDFRRRASEVYRSHLSSIQGIDMPKIDKRTTPNYAYFPILIDSEKLGL